MKNYVAKPQVGFTEAIQKNFSNLTNFTGRARRSEFWWNVLVWFILSITVSFALSSLPAINTVCGIIIMMCFLAVTARRLQDSGHSAIWVYINFICVIALTLYLQFSGVQEDLLAVQQSGDPDKTLQIALSYFMSPLYLIPVTIGTITGIPTVIFCFMDSVFVANKYGESPKYVIEGE